MKNLRRTVVRCNSWPIFYDSSPQLLPCCTANGDHPKRGMRESCHSASRTSFSPFPHLQPGPLMRGLPGGHAQILSILGHRLRTITYHLSDTLQRARYAMSRLPIPSVLASILQFLGWILRNCVQISIRLSHILLSVAIFVHTWNECRQFASQKLNGSFAPAFPISRTRFVVTLVAIPLWGITMAFLTLLWLVLIRLWHIIRPRLNVRKRYEPIAVDLNDLERAQPVRRRRRRNPRQTMDEKFAKTTRSVGWFVLWGAYLSAALSGVYMLRTYELPIDHRFKGAVELANQVPKPEGYGTGGARSNVLRQFSPNNTSRKSIYRCDVL